MSPVETKLEGKVWDCKIGPFKGKLPHGADNPLRKAIQKAFKEITGEDAEVCFSGWGGEFTEDEKKELLDVRSRVAQDLSKYKDAT